MMMMIEKKHKYMRPSELRWLKVVALVLLRLEQRIRGRTKRGGGGGPCENQSNLKLKKIRTSYEIRDLFSFMFLDGF